MNIKDFELSSAIKPCKARAIEILDYEIFQL